MKCCVVSLLVSWGLLILEWCQCNWRHSKNSPPQLTRYTTDIDLDVSIAYCRSSSGDSVDLLSRIICNAVVVSDWCITNLAHGWWVSIQSIVGIVRGGNWSLGGSLWQRSAVLMLLCSERPEIHTKMALRLVLQNRL